MGATSMPHAGHHAIDAGIDAGTDADTVATGGDPASGGHRRSRIADRWWAWALLALVLGGALLVGNGSPGSARNDADRVHAISLTMKCPVCTGQSVADSEAPVSRQMRAEIQRQVQAGRTGEEIRRFMVDAYGDEILLTPPTDGLRGLVWALPVVGVAVAGTAVGFALARGRRASGVHATDADAELVNAALAETSDRGEG